MAKIIFTSRYTRAGKSSVTRKNYINYIGTRENVEKINIYDNLNATNKQSEFIQQLMNDYKDGKEPLEYEDYINNPSIKNASELIEALLERVTETSDDRENYIKYIAERPRVDKVSTHGLFSNDGVVENLGTKAKEISEHKGIVWSHVLSLRREDAERLGYNNYQAFKDLVDENVIHLAKAHKIKVKNLKYVSAFHNESHHPHVHLVIYSNDIKEGYLTEQGIEDIRSKFANSIFKDEMYHNFSEQNKLRNELRGLSREQVNEYLNNMKNNDNVNEKSLLLIKELHKRLKNHKGSKTYKWFSKTGNEEIKNLIDELAKEISKEENVSKLYDDWYLAKENNLRIYRNTMPERVALYENENFTTIQNHIIKEILNLDFSELSDKEFTYDTYVENTDVQETNQKTYEDNDFYEPQLEDLDVTMQTENLYVDWSKKYKEAKNLLYLQSDDNSNITLAYEMLKVEASKGNILAIYDVASLNKNEIVIDEEIDIESYFNKALIGFKSIAEKESKMQSYFEYRIGKMYSLGYGTEQDEEEAFNWFLESARKGNQYAQYSLGNCYYYGTGVEINFEQAFNYYRLSTEHKRSNAFANYKLAEMYEKGVGTEKDKEESDKYYEKALRGFLRISEQDIDGNLNFKIAKIYENGLGVPCDLSKAKEYYLKAVKLDNDMAKYKLSKLYLSKEYQSFCNEPALEKDVLYAVETLKAIAETDIDIKQHIYYALGTAYLFNETLGRDIELAKEYLTKSAELGNEYAEKLLEGINNRFYSQCYNSILSGVGKLLAKSRNQEDAKYTQNENGRGVDRKVMSKIAEKKKEQGIKY